MVCMRWGCNMINVTYLQGYKIHLQHFKLVYLMKFHATTTTVAAAKTKTRQTNNTR